MRLIWSPRALQNLEEGAEWIWQTRPRAAVEWLDRIAKAARTLEDFPLGGRMVRELEDPSYREIAADGWRLVYRPFDDRVEIVALIHSSRELTWALVRESETAYRTGRSGSLPAEVPVSAQA